MNRMAPDADQPAPTGPAVDEPLVDITALADYAHFVGRSFAGIASVPRPPPG